MRIKTEFWMEKCLTSDPASTRSVQLKHNTGQWSPLSSVLCPVGNIILPGNALSLTYFGRSCSLCVEAITGEDGTTLDRPSPTSGLAPDLSEPSELDSILDSTPDDLSLQLKQLTVDDNNAEESQGTPAGPAVSTPCRPSNPPCLSSPAALSYSSENPPADGSAEGAFTLESSIASEQAVKSPTASPGGAQSTDTFYCLSCSTKVRFKEQPQQQEGRNGETRESKVLYSKIGGLSSQLDIIRETIELPLKHPELFSNYGGSDGSMWMHFYCTCRQRLWLPGGFIMIKWIL